MLADTLEARAETLHQRQRVNIAEMILEESLEGHLKVEAKYMTLRSTVITSRILTKNKMQTAKTKIVTVAIGTKMTNQTARIPAGLTSK